MLDAGLVTAVEGAHFQILHRRQPREDAAAFRRLADACCDDVVRRDAVYPPSLERDRSLFGPQHAGDRLQRGRFAGPVRADERNDLALVDGDGDAFQGMDVAVIRVNIVEFKQCHLSRSLFPPRPFVLLAGSSQ